MDVKRILYRNQLGETGAAASLMTEVPHVNRLTTLLKGLVLRSQFKQRQTADNLASLLGKEGKLPGYYAHDHPSSQQRSYFYAQYDPYRPEVSDTQSQIRSDLEFKLQHPAQQYHRGYPNIADY